MLFTIPCFCRRCVQCNHGKITIEMHKYEWNLSTYRINPVGCLKEEYLEQLTCRKVLIKGFFFLTDELETCDFTNTDGSRPNEMRNTGNGVCSECLRKTKKQQKEGILNLSTHDENVNYANALVANLVTINGFHCSEPCPSHVRSVRSWVSKLGLVTPRCLHAA